MVGQLRLPTQSVGEIIGVDAVLTVYLADADTQEHVA